MKQNKCTKFQVLMTILVMLTGVVLAVLQSGTAQAGTTPAAASPAADSKAPTAVETAQIDAFVESMMDKLQIPGVAVGVVKGDQPVYLQGYGISGPDQQPITPQTPFILGSSSKFFTALAIMQLAEQGEIDLEAPVQRYLPQFELADKEASAKILVKNLLHQDSGLSTYHGRIAFAGTVPTIDELIYNLKDTPLSEAVGTTYQYSNLNYDILGGIVQAVSGMPYAEYVQKNIYNPLDMKNSFTSTSEAKKHGLASGYQSIFGFMMPTEQPDNQSMLASAYLISSAEDMSHYLIAQINKGEFGNGTVASAGSMEQMHQPAVPDPSIDGYYGMGWEIADDVVQHAGDIECFHSDMVLDGDTGIVVLINSHDYLVRGPQFGMIASGIRDILHGQQPQEDVGSVTGTYVIIDLVCAALVMLLGVSIVNLLRWNRRFKLTPLRISIFVVCLLVFNFAAPAVGLYGLSSFAPWSVVFSFLPGLGHLAFVLCILSLCIGAIKIIRFVRSLRLHQKNEEMNL